MQASAPVARQWESGVRRRLLWRRVRDRRGCTVEIGEFQPRDRDGLLAMYSTFDLAQRAQGLPPLTEESRAAWVSRLTRCGINVVARLDGRVVGHAVLMPDRAASYELAVFVHQDHQGAGIGGALIDALLTLARRREIDRVSLSVERALEHPRDRALPPQGLSAELGRGVGGANLGPPRRRPQRTGGAFGRHPSASGRRHSCQWGGA